MVCFLLNKYSSYILLLHVLSVPLCNVIFNIHTNQSKFVVYVTVLDLKSSNHSSLHLNGSSYRDKFLENKNLKHKNL